MTRPSVILADDHKIVADGLRRLLEHEFDLVANVQDGRALVASAAELHPDVIVADISMPLLNGIEAAQQLRKAGSEAKIIFLTMHADVTYAMRAFDAGASGFVLKHSAASELTTAIREALAGRTYITPLIAKELVEACRERAEQDADPLRKLTPRQREVLQLLAEGRSAKEIAAVLNVSRRTAEFHKYRMMEELGIRTSAELIRFAIRHGVVSL
ncbi:MAG: response regulator transcription factor [Myxococcota bacterium]